MKPTTPRRNGRKHLPAEAVRQYGRRVARRLVRTLIALVWLGVMAPPPAHAAEAPVVGTPSITPDSAASAQVSVSVDTRGAATTVQVEYVTAGVYRSHAAPRVPGAATTVTLAALPASDAGATQLTGQVTGLEPGSTYRMRIKAANGVGEVVSAEVTVSTPGAPKVTFKAKVGNKTTRLTRLTVTGAAGGETAKVTCRTSSKGCPLASTMIPLAAGRTSLSRLLKGFPLAPGARVVVQVSGAGAALSRLTLTIRDDEQPKVKRGQ